MLLGLATIVYGFGLRHAVDADHIAAIDNTTRKLMQDGKYPVGVGFFFSLGHSTIVIVLSVLVAISSSYFNANLPAFKETVADRHDGVLRLSAGYRGHQLDGVAG